LKLERKRQDIHMLTESRHFEAAAPRRRRDLAVKAEAFHLLRTVTSQDFRQRVKRRVWRLRSRCAPVLKAWYGTYGNADLERELKAHLPPGFEILMVHSSVSDMQPMYQGSAKDLVELLLRVTGPERTLAMPAFFFGSADLYHRDYYRKHVRFDLRRTPSQMGLVTEVFRRWPGVARSLHPTHSVCALGPLAKELVATHHLSEWPCGELSPFGIMGRRKTAILGLGTEYYRSLTQVHSMEEILGERFPVPRQSGDPVRVQLVDREGTVIPYEMSRPLSDRVVLKLERLRDFVRPGDVEQWLFKGTMLYTATAAKVDMAIRTAAERGETLYAQRW
jgi:aminoglycoside N3'-acetyltransferase